jgi:WD40 repeat protein
MIYPHICFWDVKEGFKFLNKTTLKHNRIIECEFSPMSNMCLIISNYQIILGSNKDSESFISILDFKNNEILVTTIMSVGYKLLKWNSYLKNLEFCTLSDKLYTFWRVNTDASLQYQHGDFNFEEIDGLKNYFTTLEYTPPISNNGIILTLISISNDTIWGVDTKTNCVVIKYITNIGTPVKFMTCTLNYIILSYENKIKYYKLPKLVDISTENFNLFTAHEEELTIDSDILTNQTDFLKSNTLVLSKKGVLWCINYEEAVCVKIYSFLDMKDEIVQCKIVQKDYQYYSVKKIDFSQLKLEDVVNTEISENKYYLISGHKNGLIKVWNIPEYSLNLQFAVITEELLCFDTSPNDLKLVASYTEYLRFFEISNGKFYGKYKPISSKSFKHICFLPDGQNMFCIDLNNTIFLLKIEKYEPLLIQIHQLFNLTGEIYQFRINPIDCYNRFLINMENIFLYVYERKFTNVIRNLSYDNAVPQFSVLDKFNIDEYLKKEVNIDHRSGEVLYENFTFEFCTNDKSIVYLLSEGRKLILIRNYEKQAIVKNITFPYNPISMSFSPNSAFVIYLFRGNYF